MRALREIIGGLSLAILAVIIVIGGLWLAVTETESTQLTVTAVAAKPSQATASESSTALGSPAPTSSPVPSQATTTKATVAPTRTSTGTATDTAVAATHTLTATSAPSETATIAPSATPSPTPTTFASATACFPPPTWVPYTVAPGDTLFQLSLRFGVSAAQLQTANCLPTTEIKFNQVIYVPFVPSATPQPSATPAPTATSVANPLYIKGINLISVQADPSRANGATATLFIDFSGGVAPYTIYNDNQPQAGNPFTILTDCGGTLLHTLRVLSADGQSVEYPYYYSPVVCP